MSSGNAISPIGHPPVPPAGGIPCRQHPALAAIGGQRGPRRCSCRCGHSSPASRPCCACLAKGHPAAFSVSSGQTLKGGSRPSALLSAPPAPDVCVLKAKFWENSPKARDGFYLPAYFLDSLFPQHFPASTLQGKQSDLLISIDRNSGKELPAEHLQRPTEETPSLISIHINS